MVQSESNPPLSKLSLYSMFDQVIASNCVFVSFTGPKLPMRLDRHAMLQLGNGLAIIGGYGNGKDQAKIHLLNCINGNCSISTLSQELSMPRLWFVAIPIPDQMSGCIMGGKKQLKRGMIHMLL